MYGMMLPWLQTPDHMGVASVKTYPVFNALTCLTVLRVTCCIIKYDSQSFFCMQMMSCNTVYYSSILHLGCFCTRALLCLLFILCYECYCKQLTDSKTSACLNWEVIKLQV